jgi:hypothetical protein
MVIENQEELRHFLKQSGIVLGNKLYNRLFAGCISQKPSHNTDFMQLADKLEVRAFDELSKDVEGDLQWARGLLYSANCIRNGKLHKV